MSTETKQNWREEQAKAEIGRTEISRPLSIFLTWVFIAIMLSASLLQLAVGWAEYNRTGESPSLRFFTTFNKVLPDMKDAWVGADNVLEKFIEPNKVLLKRINEFQTGMDDSSVIARWSTGPVQETLCLLGVGNEKAFVGRNGWLFFEPGVRYISGPGFLDPEQMHKRSMMGSEISGPPQPDPVKAIVDFRDQLKERGIELVVMPAPVKASVHPEKLSTRFKGYNLPLQNESYPQFISALKEAGVHVFDPAPDLCMAKANGPQFLQTDTHWRPEAMELAAGQLAEYIAAMNLELPAVEAPVHKAGVTVTNLGDIATMLKLPEDQKLYKKETVQVEPVGGSDSEDADVLLLGDSYANIYSAEEMGWGKDAGLGEQLAAALKRPVERIVQNDSGAHATRDKLAREMLRGKPMLAGKKLLVWEFAARELAVGNWKLIDLVQKEAPVQPDVTAGVAVVSGTVADVSDRPTKGAPYKDFIMKLYVKNMVDSDGQPYGEGDGVVHVFGMRNREILPIASIQSGEKLRLKLRPWDEVEKKYGTLKAGSLADMMLEIEKSLYWGEPLKAKAEK